MAPLQRQLLARWTECIGLGEPMASTKTLRLRFFSLAGRLTRKARRLILRLPQGWPWQNQFSSALSRLRALPLPFLTPSLAFDLFTMTPHAWPINAQDGPLTVSASELR